jgi:hypothetical protein
MLNINKMLLILFMYSYNSISVYANDHYLNSNAFIDIKNTNSFNHQHYLNNTKKLKLGYSLEYKFKKTKTYLNFNVINKNQFNLQNSFFQLEKTNKTFGIGSKNYNWSFSSKNSLILSSNAQPLNSIYFKSDYQNELPYFNKASIEIINGMTKGHKNLEDPMLFGVRVTYAPTTRFELEAIRVSQWGGSKNNKSPSIITKTFFGDTNEGTHSNINQMAGIGVSYSLPKSSLPIRIYGQAVGEDEAGGLPSCLIYLSGIEWNGLLINQRTLIGLEFIDTRTRFTSNKNCGPNSAYNNHTYKYTNHGIVMGAPIDTQGRSFELFGKTSISSKIEAHLSLQKLLINSDNFSMHRLTPDRREGWFNTAGITWGKNNLIIAADLSYQSMPLEGINSKKGIKLYLHTKLNF